MARAAGLGLTITKQYLDEMRGRIEIESTEGVGTCVRVELPMTIASRELPQLLHPPRAVLVSQGAERRKLQQWLERENYICAVAGWDGARLIGDSPSAPPDVIFVTESYVHDAEKLTRYAAALYGDAIPVLLGGPTPADPNGPFVTRVEPENDDQLRNMFSLIGPGLTSDASRTHVQYRVLVVDDNETNLQSAQIALENYGHDVTVVDNGADALEVLRTQDFDLVFMDMHMPGFSGLEVSTMYATESKAPVPVVILTADATRTASADADIPEIAGFLTKPIKPSELQYALERYAVRQPREGGGMSYRNSNTR